MKTAHVFPQNWRIEKVSKVVAATKLLVSNLLHFLKPSVSLNETTGFIE
ncbi:hypothetical protein [uncultured Mediterranea sp.]|nr:hypothetical protein [uncultured Mediterranea sp.]